LKGFNKSQDIRFECDFPGLSKKENFSRNQVFGSGRKKKILSVEFEIPRRPVIEFLQINPSLSSKTFHSLMRPFSLTNETFYEAPSLFAHFIKLLSFAVPIKMSSHKQ